MSVFVNATGISFEALADFSATESLPEHFSLYDAGMDGEGFLVRFHSEPSGTWIGSFQCGLSGLSTVRMHPNGKHALVIAGGNGYVIEVETKQAIERFGGMILEVLPIPDGSDLIFAEQVRLERFGPNGVVWRSERLSWDGFRAMRIEEDVVFGESYTPLGDSWTSFTVKLSDGSVDCES